MYKAHIRPIVRASLFNPDFKWSCFTIHPPRGETVYLALCLLPPAYKCAGFGFLLNVKLCLTFSKRFQRGGIRALCDIPPKIWFQGCFQADILKKWRKMEKKGFFVSTLRGWGLLKGEFCTVWIFRSVKFCWIYMCTDEQWPGWRFYLNYSCKKRGHLHSWQTDRPTRWSWTTCLVRRMCLPDILCARVGP